MPELPEVETVRRYVEGRALGQRVMAVEVLDDRMLQGPRDLADRSVGREIKGTARHGKNLFLDLGHGLLHIHLGMSGDLRYLEELEASIPHQRLRLRLERGSLVLDDPRRFGRFGWVPSVSDLVTSAGLGPDALSVSGEEFVARIKGRRGAIKPLLLDQHLLAGVGNLYADEVLFQERLPPTIPARCLSQEDLEGLGCSVRRVLGASIEVGTDLERLPSGYLLRQRVSGGPCPRCGAILLARKVGGRTTIFCPECQVNAPGSGC